MRGSTQRPRPTRGSAADVGDDDAPRAWTDTPSADAMPTRGARVRGSAVGTVAAETMVGSLPGMASGTPWGALLDELAGEVVLRHVPGRRVLDLGYGSPEVTEWVRERTGEHLSIVEKGALEPHDGEIRLDEYADAEFDVVYSLRTFPHLGTNTSSSERLARGLLAEAARVTCDGGTVLIEIANNRSVLGLAVGIRNPITVVSRGRMIRGDRFGLTRWDNPRRFVGYLPPTLELVDHHGLGVFTSQGTTLRVPLIGPVVRRLEWFARDHPLLANFGARQLIELRRLHRR